MYTIQDIELADWTRAHGAALVAGLLAHGYREDAAELCGMLGTSLPELASRARAEIARREADDGPGAA